MDIRIWCNAPRRSNRIAQMPPEPKFEGRMNFNLTFSLGKSCDDATKVERIGLFQSMVQNYEKLKLQRMMRTIIKN